MIVQPGSLDSTVDDYQSKSGGASTNQFDPASLINEFNKQQNTGTDSGAPSGTQLEKQQAAQKSKFMDNITRRKEEKAASSARQSLGMAEQIAYIGKISNDNNSMNNFFISDASSIMQPHSLSGTEHKKTQLTAL